MRVRRVIATTVAGAGLVLGAASAAGAQSPVSVLPTELTQPPTTAPTRVQGEVLARTGSDIGEYVLVGGALAAGGAVLVLGARKRRHAAA